jgi:hypothetical protein
VYSGVDAVGVATTSIPHIVNTLFSSIKIFVQEGMLSISQLGFTDQYQLSFALIVIVYFSTLEGQKNHKKDALFSSAISA